MEPRTAEGALRAPLPCTQDPRPAGAGLRSPGASPRGSHEEAERVSATSLVCQLPWDRQGSGGSSLRPLSGAVSSQTLTYEIILTLGQAFEVAYQLALQAQKSRPLGASAAETIEAKSSKPVPKPRVGMRKSAVRARRRGSP